MRGEHRRISYQRLYFCGSRTDAATAGRPPALTLMWLLYQLATTVALILVSPFLLLGRGGHYMPTLRGRLGLAQPPPPGARPLWIHAVSVGEIGVADTLIQSLPSELPLLVTTVTPTGQARAQARLGEHENIGHVRTLYDEVLRVPLIVKLPSGDARIESLRASREALVRHVDVAPTLLDLIGLDPLPDQVGASLLDSPGSLLQTETHAPEAPQTKLALRSDRHKLVFTPETGRFELYDLESDPGELHDLYEASEDEFSDWSTALRQWAERAPGVGELDPSVRSNLKALGY